MRLAHRALERGERAARARGVVDGVRAELGLGPFPAVGHTIHMTVCKVTGARGDHAALRARLARWPQGDGERFPKRLRSLAEALAPGS